MKKKEKTVRILMVILVLLLGEIALAVDWDPNTPFIKVQLSWAQIQNIAFNEEDNIYISGTYHGPTAIENHTTGKVFVAKFDPSGREQWMKKIGEGDNSQGDNPQLAYSDGIVYFLWGGFPEEGGYKTYISKLDKNSGNEILRQIVLNDWVSSMAADNNGIYLAYDHPNPYRLGSILTKFNKDGTKIWDLDLSGGHGGSFITDIVLNNNDIYLGGSWAYWGSYGIVYDAYTGKVSKDKEKIWSKRWTTSTDDEVYSIALGSSGLYVLGATGHSETSGSHGLLIKYDFDGNLLWDSEDFTELKELLSSGQIWKSWYDVTTDNSGVYLGGYHRVVKLDADKLDNKEGQGLVLWEIIKKERSFIRIAINKNNLLIATDRYGYWGNIYCFNVITGEQTTYQPRTAVKDWQFYE